MYMVVYSLTADKINILNKLNLIIPLCIMHILQICIYYMNLPIYILLYLKT